MILRSGPRSKRLFSVQGPPVRRGQNKGQAVFRLACWLAIGGSGNLCDQKARAVLAACSVVVIGKPRPFAGVANNTLDTYESANVVITNLPSACRSAMAALISVRGVVILRRRAGRERRCKRNLRPRQAQEPWLCSWSASQGA